MNTADERRSARSNVLLAATVEWGPKRSAVRIKNLSAHGAMVVGIGLPPAEAEVNLEYMGETVSGWIAWSRDGRAGIEFGAVIEPERLHLASPHPHPLIVKDTRELDCRRPGFRGRLLTEEEARIVDEWNRGQRLAG